MNIECILRRPGGTKAEIGGIEYHFSPLEDGAHVTNVDEPAHIDRFLSIADAYKVYHGALQALTNPVKLSAAAPAATTTEATPETLGLVGSDDHPPQFDIGGTIYTLGDVVRKAFKDSGMEYDAWNEMHDDDRKARIDMALDDLADAAEKAAAAQADPQTRDEWAAVHLAKFGKLPHHKASIETIKKAIAEA